MANVKQVNITGEVPFNLNEHEGLAAKLAALNTPTMGLKITYGKQTRLAPNQYGGKTAMYEFALVGQEAVNNVWLQSFINQIKEVGGTIKTTHVYDMEAQEQII